MNNKLIGTEKNIIFYNDEEGNIKIEVLLEKETSVGDISNKIKVSAKIESKRKK